MFSWPTNYDSCYTLSGTISREGIGLHSGEKTRVSISSYEKEGYYVSFSDKPKEIFKLTQDLIGSTMLCTAVKLGGRNLYTIEHLLSSLAGCGLSYIHIEVEGKEIPLLDGSAIQWVRDFEGVGIKKALKPNNFFREINKPIILNKEGSVIAATPYEKTTIISTISFPYKAIGNQTFVYRNYWFREKLEILNKEFNFRMNGPFYLCLGTCEENFQKWHKGYIDRIDKEKTNLVETDVYDLLTDDEINQIGEDYIQNEAENRYEYEIDNTDE